ncbi:ty3-gypsy retrotransposon protein [Tanacetum coccineum]
MDQYLRAMVLEKPHHWVCLLPWTEYSYNTSFHSSIKMTTYQVVYGRVLPTIITYPLGSSKVAAVEETLIERDSLLRRLKQNLLVTKHRIEMQANRKCWDVKFNIKDMVLVLERVGKVSYRLALLDFSKIHPVFHVSLLKPLLGTDQVQVMALPNGDHKGLSPDEATWEWLFEFKTTYPSYHLEDKVIFKGEGNVTP